MLTGIIPVLLDDDVVLARRRLDSFDETIATVAIGWPLFVSSGLDLVGPIRDSGRSAFLDLGIDLTDEETPKVMAVAADLDVGFVSVSSRSLDAEAVALAPIDLVVHIGLAGEENHIPTRVVEQRWKQCLQLGVTAVSVPAGTPIPEPDRGRTIVLEMASDRSSYLAVSGE